MWYVTVCKEGTRNHATNFEPWVNYSPHMAWLGGLWDAKKLSHARFQELSAEFRTGHSKRKRDVTAVQRAELEAPVHAHAAAEPVSFMSPQFAGDVPKRPGVRPSGSKTFGWH